jgi:hypothetical protein
VEYDPFSDQVLDDPHPVYRRLRAEAPCYLVEKYRAWALSRFQDVWDASMDEVHYTTTRGTSSPQLLTKVLPAFPNLNHLDPPLHTRMRRQLAGFFTPRAAARHEGAVRGFARECFEGFRERGRCDAVGDLGARVAAKVACLVNGFPIAESDRMVELVKRFFRREEGVTGMTADGVAAFQEIQAWLLDLVRERRRRGAGEPSPVETYVRLELDGRRLEDEVVASHLVLLLIGATETFPKVFASALCRLAEYPEQRAECAADPALVPHAFEEVLRYDMPTQFLCRTVAVEHRLHGQTLRPGDVVLFLYPSANRDEREFRDPDVFDIHRRAPRMLSFGHGTHRCLGANFARLEGRVLLEAVLEHMPDYEVDLAGIERERTEFVKGITRLPIRFRPF